MTALQNGTDGGNGLYRYTSTPSTFPDQSFNSENYWVDVVFEDGPDTTKPTVTATHACVRCHLLSAWAADVTATFSEPIQQSTLSLELRAAPATPRAGPPYDAATARGACPDVTAGRGARTG